MTDPSDVDELRAFLARSGEMGFPADILRDARRWRELVQLLKLWGWHDMEITPARIKQQLPVRFPFGEFRSQSEEP